jgi:hypothetical protein
MLNETDEDENSLTQFSHMNFHFTVDTVLFITVAYGLCIDFSAEQMP